MIKILLFLSFLSHFIYILWKLKKNLHSLQLNSYRNNRYIKWLYKTYAKTMKPRDILPFFAIFPLFFDLLLFSVSIWIFSYLFLFLTRDKFPEKKKFVFTSRAKRLFSLSLLMLFVFYSLAFHFTLNSGSNYITVAVYTFLYILNIFSFSIILAGNFIIAPLENTINRWYYNDAKKYINKLTNLSVIGITGSFGKTSTKYILNKILCDEFNVLMTPESYNTSMGVTKVIRTLLKPIHDIFIVEMGAKQRGDIKELCNLVSPKFGILTAIDEQHLETFKSIENIKQTKGELIKSLPENGVAILNYDNKHIRELSQSINIKKICYGIEYNDLDYSVCDIKITSDGSKFTVCKYNGDKVVFQTKLLGIHNIYNILAAVSVASEFGINLTAISNIVKNLEPIPHRLELKRTPQNITIIDDAFNSNLVGSHIALNVLQDIQSNKKILVTPGMIELGEREYEINRIFGNYAAKVCDYIILVGPKQTVPIQEELKFTNYSNERYFIAKDFFEARQHLHKIAQPGDVVLFENDLPDTYNE